MLEDRPQQNVGQAADRLIGGHPTPAVIVTGDGSQGGSYVLRIRVHRTISVTFGRFNRGQPIAIPAGEYLYVGSAMGGLARRLIRHASRSRQKLPQPVRDELIHHFNVIGLGQGILTPSSDKRLHWNVDHLLDNAEAELMQVFAIRSSIALEAALGKRLEKEPTTFVVVKGLGAGDVPGNTHILGIHADETWWQTIPEILDSLHAREAK